MDNDIESASTNHSTCSVTNNSVNSVKQQDNNVIHIPGDKEERNAKEKYRSEMTVLLCGVYGLVIVVIGFVFPTSSVLTHVGPIGEDYYVEVFHLYNYTVSLLFLIYLHICFIYDSSSSSSIFVWKPQSASEIPGHFSTISTIQKQENGHSFKTYQKDGEGGCAIPYDDTIKPEIPNSSSSQGEEEDKEHPFIYHGAEGVSFYLRLGAIGFATGSMIHDGFKVAQTFELDGQSRNCYGFMYIVTAVAHLLFTFLQTFFIFKNHQLIINHHKAFIRLGLAHLVATNISVWSQTVVHEIAEDIKQKFEIMELPDFDANFTFTTDVFSLTKPCDEGTDSLARRSARFLFPCTIEYSLIAAAVVHKIFKNVGTTANHPHHYHHFSHTMPSCHKANRGLFLGLFIGVLTLISISLFYVFQEQQPNMAAYIFFSSEITLLSVTCFAVCVGFNRMNKLHFIGNKEGAHSGLLVFSVFGVLVFNCFSTVSSLHSIGKGKDTMIASLALVTSLLGFIQASLQTIFIMDGLGRCSNTTKHVTLKPGRTVITFLLMCNISLWLINTFEMERTDSFPIHTEYYGSLPWSIVNHFCLPLLIFFRFHSSICLSDVWIEAYEIKTKGL